MARKSSLTRNLSRFLSYIVKYYCYQFSSGEQKIWDKQYALATEGSWNGGSTRACTVHRILV